MGDISDLLLSASLSRHYSFSLVFKCDLKNFIYSTAVLMNFHAVIFLFVLKVFSIFTLKSIFHSHIALECLML